MCGRFTLRQTTDVSDRFQAALDLDGDTMPRFNVAPTQTMPIVVEEPDGRHLRRARWGLIPSWAKEPGIGNRLINARAESLAEKPSFRSALRARRCLVPADGFFEWQRAATAAAKPARGRAGTAAKTPYFIHRRDDGLFAFAGLYEHWRDPAGRPVTSYTIIATSPNALMEPLHDRMPAILLPEHEAAWLDADVTDGEAWRDLLQPYPADLLEAYPISTLVNSPSHDQPEVLLPVS